MRDAWLQLARDVGHLRALWLAAQRSLDGLPSRPPGYARVPRAALLPERFVAHVWLDDARAAPLRRACGTTYMRLISQAPSGSALRPPPHTAAPSR